MSRTFPIIALSVVGGVALALLSLAQRHGSLSAWRSRRGAFLAAKSGAM
jgi:hypothetical protein